MTKETIPLKKKLAQEMRLFLIYASYLIFFFCSMITYRRLLLGEYSISYFHYGYGVVQALILAKIILVGEALGLGEKFSKKPLIIPTFYKAIIFGFFVLIFNLFEHFLTGYLHGIAPGKVYQDLLAKGMDQILAEALVVFFAFIPFFAFVETGRVLGEGKLINLFISRKDSDLTPS